MAYDRQGIASDEFGQIRPGWKVVGSDGNEIGEVSQVESQYFVISQGLIFTSERYIPITAVRAIEPEMVHLSVTGDEVEQYGWDSPEAIRSSMGTREEATSPPPASTEPPSPETGRTAQDSEHMELREEELRARKDTVESGQVDVGKEVYTEREEMDVPRRHEEVDINYRPTEARRPAEGEIGESEEIHVPLHEEQVNVDKETVVSGEVDIDKREVEDTERVSEEVRKERLRVEREGDVRINEEDDLEEERGQ